MTKECPTIDEAAINSVVMRAQDAMDKLCNGVGVQSPDPEHAAISNAIICLSEMMIPVYRHVAELEIVETTSIKTKWFTATGKSMMALAMMVCVMSICWTIVQVLGPK